jgi:dihydrofolate synthase/folylpolyglutamate synthase
MKKLNYSQAYDYMLSLQKSGIKLGLEQTRLFFSLLGNPDKNLKFIHLAGSNGKGSCAAMLNAVLQEAGYKVGFFSSPHLIDIRERFRINGNAITKKHLAALISDMQDSVTIMQEKHDSTPTFFEFNTALAALYFAREKVDFVIWETGMGGRFDSTNIVKSVCSIITSISLDHQDYLGDTIEKIAAEKAGIIKTKRPVFVGSLSGEALNVIRTEADKKNSLLIEPTNLAIKNICYEKSQGKIYQKFNYAALPIKLALLGSVQRNNFKLVFNVLDYLAAEFGFEFKKAMQGIHKAFWPGRVQFVDNIIIDGAHNVEAITALLETAKELPIKPRIPIIFGGFKDKDTCECLKLLASIALEFIFLPLTTNIKESYLPQELVLLAEKTTPTIPVKTYDSATKALEHCEKNEHTLVCGSLYLAGEFLQKKLPANAILDI